MAPSPTFKLVGASQFNRCLARTRSWGGGGLFDPVIDLAVSPFIGVGNFWHSYEYFTENPQTPFSYDRDAYLEDATTFCGLGWAAMIEQDPDRKNGRRSVVNETSEEVEEVGRVAPGDKWRERVPAGSPEYLAQRCFIAAWIVNVLDGLGKVPSISAEPVAGLTFLGPKEFTGSWMLGAVMLHARKSSFDYSCPARRVSDDLANSTALQDVVPHDLATSPTSAPSRTHPVHLFVSAMVVAVVVALAYWRRQTQNRRIVLMPSKGNWEDEAASGTFDLPAPTSSSRGLGYRIRRIFSPFATPGQKSSPANMSASHHYVSMLADEKSGSPYTTTSTTVAI